MVAAGTSEEGIFLPFPPGVNRRSAAAPISSVQRDGNHVVGLAAEREPATPPAHHRAGALAGLPAGYESR